MGAGIAQWSAHELFLGHLSTSAGAIPSHAQISTRKKILQWRPKDLTPRFFPTSKTPIGGSKGSPSPTTQ